MRNPLHLASGEDILLENVNAGEEEDSGRVRVFARIRPMNGNDIQCSDKNVIRIAPVDIPKKSNSEDTIKAPMPRSMTVLDDRSPIDFRFDSIFGENSCNEDVFRGLGKEIVQAATDGYNGTVLAYGQTGSGKTHTMTSADGLVPRMLTYLFMRIGTDSRHQYKVLVTYLQIYQENLYDLLSNENQKSSKLYIRERKDKGVYVEGLKEFVARSPSEIFELVKAGRKRLIFAETKMNRHSSRSHAVLGITVERQTRRGVSSKDNPTVEIQQGDIEERAEEVEKIDDTDAKVVSDDSTLLPQSQSDGFISYMDLTHDPDMLDLVNDKDGEESNNKPVDLIEDSEKDVLVRGRLSLVDLAGSERIKKTGAVGEQLEEAKKINESLLQLGNVIASLSTEGHQHVPFRNSTLTRLLQESLGGNCKTSLIVCVSPAKRDIGETKGTLNFGLRAMRVKNCARVNVDVDYELLASDLAASMEIKERVWKDKCRQLEQRIAEMCKESELQEQNFKNDIDYTKKTAEERSHAAKKKHENEIKRMRTKISSMESTLALSDETAKRVSISQKEFLAQIASRLKEVIIAKGALGYTQYSFRNQDFKGMNESIDCTNEEKGKNSSFRIIIIEAMKILRGSCKVGTNGKSSVPETIKESSRRSRHNSQSANERRSSLSSIPTPKFAPSENGSSSSCPNVSASCPDSTGSHHSSFSNISASQPDDSQYGSSSKSRDSMLVIEQQYWDDVGLSDDNFTTGRTSPCVDSTASSKEDQSDDETGAKSAIAIEEVNLLEHDLINSIPELVDCAKLELNSDDSISRLLSTFPSNIDGYSNNILAAIESAQTDMMKEDVTEAHVQLLLTIFTYIASINATSGISCLLSFISMGNRITDLYKKRQTMENELRKSLNEIEELHDNETNLKDQISTLQDRVYALESQLVDSTAEIGEISKKLEVQRVNLENQKAITHVDVATQSDVSSIEASRPSTVDRGSQVVRGGGLGNNYINNESGSKPKLIPERASGIDLTIPNIPGSVVDIYELAKSETPPLEKRCSSHEIDMNVIKDRHGGCFGNCSIM